MNNWTLRIEGVHLLGPPPIESLYVPITPGLRAFYGLNGAGKTRLIRAITDVLSGEGSGFVVGRAVHGASTSGLGDLTSILKPEGAGTSDPVEWAEAVLGQASPDLLALDSLAAVTAANILTQANNIGDLRSMPDALSELVRQHRFTLSSIGLGERSIPRWAVAPAVAVDGSTPALMEELTRLNQLGAALQLDLLAGDSHAELWTEDDSAFTAAAHSVGVELLDGLFTTLSPFFVAIRDPDADLFLEELEMLNRSAISPYRVGDGDLFDSLAIATGQIAHIVRDDDLDIERVRQFTTDSIRRSPGGQEPLTVDGETVQRSELLGRAAWDLQSKAQPLYDSLLLDAPELVLSISAPSNWLFGEAVEWKARMAGNDLISLAELSEAQRRWAVVCLALSLDHGPDSAVRARRAFGQTEVPTGVLQEFMRIRTEWAGWVSNHPTVIALDEPDGALHATAQRHAVEGLVQLVSERECLVLCATHSREFLNHHQIELHHVTRSGAGKLQLRTLTEPSSLRLNELGIAPADLFLLHRVIILVEGAHDQIVLQGLIGEELLSSRVLTVPIRGGRLLSTTVDSWVLSNFSDSPVVAVLDNLRAGVIQEFWNDIRTHNDAGQSRFDQIVRDHFSAKKRTEEQFVIDYCRTIAERGLMNRFHIFGLEKGDIPEYLPHAPLGMPKPWPVLRAEFESQSKLTSFKPWLNARYGVEIDAKNLKYAIAQMDDVPSEFVALADFCTALSRRPNRST